MRVSDLLKAIAPLLDLDRAAGKDAPGELAATLRALESVATMIRAERDALITAAQFHCNTCNRKWSVPMTVAEAREAERWTPEDCPRCYNAANPGKCSGYTDRARYEP